MDLPHSLWDDSDHPPGDPPLVTLDRDTSLERLNVVFAQPDPGADEEYVDRARLVLDLIGRSPNLCQLSVEDLDIRRESIRAQVLRVFTKLNKLEEFHWPIYGQRFKAFIKDSPGAFHNIRRLVLKCADVRQSVSLNLTYLLYSRLIQCSLNVFHHFLIWR